MNATFKRRIERIEQISIPKQPVLTQLLGEPAEDASPEEWRQFADDKAAAEAVGKMIILLCPLKADE